MALINIIPLFASLHLGGLVDSLNVSLVTARLVHRSACIMALMLLITHLLLALTATPSFDLGLSENLFAVIVSA
jgi:hypothetical protein